jgi:hypothetical protein
MAMVVRAELARELYEDGTTMLVDVGSLLRAVVGDGGMFG